MKWCCRMNIYFQTIFFPGAPRIHFIFEGIVFVRKCVNLNSLYGVPWQSKLLYIHIFFQFANEILLWLWNVFLLLCGLVTRCVTMRNNTCYWNNAWRQNNKPGLLLKIISMNFPMGFILDGALSKRHLKMVLKNKIVERCVEKLPQRKRNPSKCRSEQLSGIIYSFVHVPANLNEHIFQTDICS